MPGTSGYTSDTDSDLWKANQEAGANELRTRQERHTKAWQYYDGDHKKHLKPDKSKTEDNIVLNKIGQAADSAVAGLMGRNDQGLVEGVRFDVADTVGEKGVTGRLVRGVRRMRGETESREQRYLDDVWSINQRALFQQALALNGCMTGHCFVRLVPSGIYYWPKKTTVARLINLDPSSVTAFWDGSDVGRVLFYRLDYGDRREDIVRAVNDDGDDVNAWTFYHYRRVRDETAKKKEDQEKWLPVGAPEAWERPWCPIIDWPNLPRPNLFYGKSDVGQLLGLNDSVNFTVSNLQRILKLNAHPKRFGTGFAANALEETKVDDFFAINNKDANIQQLEMMSDLSSSLAFAQLLIRSIFDEARELDPQSVMDKLGDLTNFALRVLNGSTLGKIGVKRMLYGGRGWTAINQALLDLGGYDPATEVVNLWPDPLPVNALEEAQALDIDRKHGASQSSYLEKRGYDPETEAQRATESAESGQQALVNLLAGMGDRGFGL